MLGIRKAQDGWKAPTTASVPHRLAILPAREPDRRSPSGGAGTRSSGPAEDALRHSHARSKRTTVAKEVVGTGTGDARRLPSRPGIQTVLAVNRQPEHALSRLPQRIQA